MNTIVNKDNNLNSLKHNFGIQLDDLPNVISEDLELVCHKNKLYGGQKSVEKQLGFTGRESKVDNHADVNIIMNQLLMLEAQISENPEDEQSHKLRYKLMKHHLLYNKDDVRGMYFIDQKLNNIKFEQDKNSIIEKDEIKCKILENICSENDNDTMLKCETCGYYYLSSDETCQVCRDDDNDE